MLFDLWSVIRRKVINMNSRVYFIICYLNNYTFKVPYIHRLYQAMPHCVQVWLPWWLLWGHQPRPRGQGHAAQIYCPQSVPRIRTGKLDWWTPLTDSHYHWWQYIVHAVFIMTRGKIFRWQCHIKYKKCVVPFWESHIEEMLAQNQLARIEEHQTSISRVVSVIPVQAIFLSTLFLGHSMISKPWLPQQRIQGLLFVIKISSVGCKTFVSTLFYITSYNSFNQSLDIEKFICFPLAKS